MISQIPEWRADKVACDACNPFYKECSSQIWTSETKELRTMCMTTMQLAYRNHVFPMLFRFGEFLELAIPLWENAVHPCRVYRLPRVKWRRLSAIRLAPSLNLSLWHRELAITEYQDEKAAWVTCYYTTKSWRPLHSTWHINVNATLISPCSFHT